MVPLNIYDFYVFNKLKKFFLNSPFPPPYHSLPKNRKRTWDYPSLLLSKVYHQDRVDEFQSSPSIFDFVTYTASRRRKAFHSTVTDIINQELDY
jgi:hypothetical protein